jgi:transcriptional regulator with XRE-family HTH domain
VRLSARDRARRAGKNIKRFREAKGLSQEALAKDLGFALGTSVSSLERGKTTLSLEVALLVCDVLQISLSELLETEDDAAL